MSKANRRRQRPGSQPSNARPNGGSTPASSAGDLPAAADRTPTGADEMASDAGATGLPGAAAAATTRSTGSGRPVGATPRTSGVRHGRRERSRAMYKPSFMERYRTAIVAGAAVLGIALVA
ncbi:MAG TPA: hypothetical protein VGO15_05360, partial [Candidatus Limnocylindrales bacterium]|nr:hypothetical protein [Candidatus Limnocylindrales bacterium]